MSIEYKLSVSGLIFLIFLLFNDMKLLQINTSLNTSSTGKIVNQIGDMCIKNGDESYIMYSGRYSSSISKSITYKIGTRLDFYLHAFITRVFDNMASPLIGLQKKC